MSALDGGVPLDQLGRVALVEHKILMPGDITIGSSGMGFDNCTQHARVIDIMRGVAYYVPMTDKMADAIADAITHNTTVRDMTRNTGNRHHG